MGHDSCIILKNKPMQGVYKQYSFKAENMRQQKNLNAMRQPHQNRPLFSDYVKYKADERNNRIRNGERMWG